MKLDQLIHFVAVIEHESLRAAARRLNVPQPALTRSIRLLEKGARCRPVRAQPVWDDPYRSGAPVSRQGQLCRQ